MVIKIKVMDYIYILKPFNWLKGSFMVFIGLLVTRWGIGVGRFTINLYYGLPIYFLISISGMLIVLAFRLLDVVIEEKRKGQFKRIKIISAISFLIAFGLSLFQTINYNLCISNIYFLAGFGILLFLSVQYGSDSGWKAGLGSFIMSLTPSYGILYGAALNDFPLSITIFVFFGIIFYLQTSKDIINECKFIERDRREGFKSFAIDLGEKRAQRLSFIADIITIVLLILPSIPNLFDILSEILYTIPMSVALILIGIAAFLTYRMNIKRTYYKSTKILLRFAMFFVLTSFLLADF